MCRVQVCRCAGVQGAGVQGAGVQVCRVQVCRVQVWKACAATCTVLRLGTDFCSLSLEPLLDLASCPRPFTELITCWHGQQLPNQPILDPLPKGDLSEGGPLHPVLELEAVEGAAVRLHRGAGRLEGAQVVDEHLAPGGAHRHRHPLQVERAGGQRVLALDRADSLLHLRRRGGKGEGEWGGREWGGVEGPKPPP